MARLELISSSWVREHGLLVGGMWWDIAKRRLIHWVHMSKGGIKGSRGTTKGWDVKEDGLHCRQEG